MKSTSRRAVIRAFDHIVLTAADLEASMGFYRDVLGMREVRFGDGRVALRFGAQKINLHQAGAEFTPHASAPTVGALDFCLQVEGGLEALQAELASAGIPIECGPVERTGAAGPICSLYVRDPDGNLIELAEPLHAPIPAVTVLPRPLPERTVLRCATLADAAGCLAIYAPIIEHTHTSFETEVPSLEDFRARMRVCLDEHSWLVVEQDDAILAYAYSSAHRSRAAYAIACEVSVYVADQAQRHGLARLLYEEVLARASAAGKRRAYAIITLPNAASVAFHERLGFRPLAHFPEAGQKFGRLWDVGWWARQLA